MPTQKQYLDNEGLTELLDELGQHLKSKLDKLTVGDGIAIDNSDTIRTTGIPYGECDSTSTATAFTATVPGIYKLEDGVCCMVKNGVVTSAANFTLNINGLGAKPSYNNMATGNDITPTAPTRDTTIFNINYTMLFIYSETIVDGGGWICYRGYDNNTNTIGYQVRSNSMSLPASQKFYRYRLLFTSADGTHYVPANTSSSTNATASRTVNQTPIDPFGHIVYYGTTAAVDANARPSAGYLWIIYTLTLGYSFNRTGAALTLTSWKPVYIKCTPQENGSAIIDADTPYVQDLPTTADGKIYIFLGVAYSATAIELLNNHPVYYHDGEGIRLWTGKDTKSIEYYNLERDSNLTPIFAAILGITPTQSDLNTACEYLLNLVDSQGDSHGCSKKVIYQFKGRICLRLFHEGQLWNAGGSDNPNDSCEVDFELFDAYTNVSMLLRVSRDNSGNWHPYVYTQSLIPQIQGDGNAITGVNTIDGQFILEKDTTFLEELTFDSTPTANSNNPVTSLGIKSALDNKQNKPIELLIWLLQNFPSGLPDNEEDARTLTSDEAAALLSILDPSIKWTVFGIDAFIDIDYALNLGDYKWEVGLFGQSSNLTTVYIHKTNDDKCWAELQLRDLLFSDSFKTINNLIIVGSGNIDTSELYIVPSQSTGALLYAAAGYVLDQSQINTICEEILTALKNGKKLYFEFDNSGEGSANETYVATYTDYVEQENRSTVVNFIVNYNTLAFYKVTLTKAYGATNWVVTYVNKSAQDKIVNIYETGNGNAVTNWTIDNGSVTLTKGTTFQEQLVSGTNIKTINNNSLLGSGDVHFDGSNLVYSGDEIQELVAGETIDENLDRLDVLVHGKQDTLVSGTNIKTVNNNSLLGEGNVQVGDITGEELETEIEELESTLLTDALRKSEQVLSQPEKTQVLTNLGIADVAKESNLKTINGASIVGSGDILVVSVDAGDINVLQTTGESLVNVMSQKAVSEITERLRDVDLSSAESLAREKRLPFGYEELDYINNGSSGSGATIDTGLVADDANWKFIGSWARTGSISSAYASIMANYLNDNANVYRICTDGYSVNGIRVNGFNKANSPKQKTLKNTSANVWHTYELYKDTLILDGETISLNTTAGNATTASIELGSSAFGLYIGEFKAYHNDSLVADLVPCIHGTTVGMYDIVRNTFYVSDNVNSFEAGNLVAEGADRIINGAGLSSLITQEIGSSTSKMMSQDATTQRTLRLDIESLYSITQQIEDLLVKKGWLLDKALSTTGEITDSIGYCVSPYIPMEGFKGDTLVFSKGDKISKNAVWYDNDKVLVKYYTYANNPQTYNATSNDFDDAKFVRLTFLTDALYSCYLYNSTTGEYIIKMDDYIDLTLKDASVLIDYPALDALTENELGEDAHKFMSQKAITDKFSVARYESIKPSYFKGALLYINFVNNSDYSPFDPRNCHGLTIVVPRYNHDPSVRSLLLGLYKSGYGALTGVYGINQQWGSLHTGLWSNYYGTNDGGVNFGNVWRNSSHLAVTVDYKTGTSKLYINGELKTTSTPSTYDYETILSYINDSVTIALSLPASNTNSKAIGIAVFGNVLTDSDIQDIYGGGYESALTQIVPDTWKANSLAPKIYNTITMHQRVGTYSTDENDNIVISPASGGTLISFGFTGISGVANNCIYEWDFEVTNGESVHTSATESRKMRIGGSCYRNFVITDSEGNDVTLSTLGIGTYHVVAKPNNILATSHNASGFNLGYYFYGADDTYTMVVKSPLVVQERGAGLICDINNYRGSYWEQKNGVKLPVCTNAIYDNATFAAYYDIFKQNVIIYSSSARVLFNGLMAIDITNGKVYVGYLTGSGGTWKQINNS